MMFGYVLRRLSEISDDDVALILELDIVRLARLRTAADAQAQSLTGYIHDAVCWFLEKASEEDWTTAMGRMRSDPMPGDRLIELAVEQQLHREIGRANV